MPQRHRWLVLYTRPRYEKKVDARLRELGIESYLPLREELRQWTDRKKLVDMPLFPGYIFVYVDEKQRMEAIAVEGAMKYISFNGKIAEVKSRTIDDLKLLMTRPEGVRVEEAGLKIGQIVKVKFGPLAGLKGTLITQRGPTRVGVLVEVIDKIVSVEIPVGDLDIVTHTTP